MADRIKREASPADYVDENRWGSYEEVTVIKTEVREELYEYETEEVDVKPFDAEHPNLMVIKTEAIEGSVNGRGLKYPDYGDCGFERRVYSKLNKRDYAAKWRNRTCGAAKEKLFRCETCRYETAQKAALKRHALIKHTDGAKRYECESCGHTTAYKGALNKHLLTHSKEKYFKCTHKNCKCNGGESCGCNSCEYATAFKSNFMKHVSQNHSDEEKKHKCEVCEYSTVYKGDLKRHLSIHLNVKPYRCTYKECKCADSPCGCSVCDYASVQKNALERHILQRHSNEEKKYKCDYCEHSSHLKANLVRHMRIHTNDRPFRCGSCEYAAADKSSLKCHVLLRHSNKEKKFKCKYCGHATHLKATLRSHMRIHTRKLSAVDE